MKHVKLSKNYFCASCY